MHVSGGKEPIFPDSPLVLLALLVLLVLLVLVIVLVAVLLQKCRPIPPSSWITAIKKMEKLTICLHRVSASA